MDFRRYIIKFQEWREKKHIHKERKTYGRMTYLGFPSASCPIGALVLQDHIKRINIVKNFL